jgi:hypothetical protein
LESRLNVLLFHRSTRNVSLTDAGKRFFARLRPALVEIADVADELGEFTSKLSGALRINADATAAEQVLAPLVLEFMATFPDVPSKSSASADSSTSPKTGSIAASVPARLSRRTWWQFRSGRCSSISSSPHRRMLQAVPHCDRRPS